MRYLVVIEPAETGFSAYAPDLPGCVATGAAVEEVECEMREAVEFHVEGLKLEGYPVPAPSARSAYVEVASGIAGAA